jgi:hypothetical protein
MQRTLDMEAIFPIKDAASAALMAVKAEYPHKAGIISAREKRWVDTRVRAFLNNAEVKDAAVVRPPTEPVCEACQQDLPIADDGDWLTYRRTMPRFAQTGQCRLLAASRRPS